MHETYPTELNWLVTKLDLKVSREYESKELSSGGRVDVLLLALAFFSLTV